MSMSHQILVRAAGSAIYLQLQEKVPQHKPQLRQVTVKLVPILLPTLPDADVLC